MLEGGPGIGKINDCVSAGASISSRFRCETIGKGPVDSSFKHFQQINRLLYNFRSSCQGQRCFPADCGRLSASAGFSLEGSKDSRLFPYFSEMPDPLAAAATVRELSACSGAGASCRTLREGSAAAAAAASYVLQDEILGIFPPFQKENLGLLIECNRQYNILCCP